MRLQFDYTLSEWPSGIWIKGDFHQKKIWWYPFYSIVLSKISWELFCNSLKMYSALVSTIRHFRTSFERQFKNSYLRSTRTVWLLRNEKGAFGNIHVFRVIGADASRHVTPMCKIDLSSSVGPRKLGMLIAKTVISGNRRHFLQSKKCTIIYETKKLRNAKS